jgi:hypothetical protein
MVAQDRPAEAFADGPVDVSGHRMGSCSEGFEFHD